jgi:hypothetical protein
VEKYLVECDTRIVLFPRPLTTEDDQTGDGSSYSVSLQVIPGEIAISDSEKAEALVSLENLFQPVTDSSVTAIIEMVDLALRSHFLTLPANPS